ncbi:MAG: UDP-N-acetylglucosamine 2-epimerase (non-hydrolyzing) [Bacteroidetes bacterium]|nr:UDP-N-acetylglucosamine 2-epimerase (non-hydrolyzing) [Bacteroidota bacterium]
MQKNKKNILIVLGTRPEIIKLFVLYRELKKSAEFNPILFNSAQQTISEDILSYLSLNFDMTAEEIPNRNSDLELFVAHLMKVLNDKFVIGTSGLNVKDLAGVVVQGDTVSAYTGAVWGFLNQIPVFHVEAGLRTFDHLNPFPEEFFRESIGRVASINFCPTKISFGNLLREGVNPEKCHIVGNTINDAIVTLINENKIKDYSSEDYILSTLHRRENWDKVTDYSRILNKLLKDKKTERKIIHLLHPNPAIRKSFYGGLNGSTSENLVISDPVNDYFEMLGMVRNAHTIISDSGGLQEESLFFNIPCGIMRKVTERPEVLEKNAKLLNFDFNEVSSFIDYSEYYRNNIEEGFDYTFGRGDTSVKIYEILKKYYNLNHKEK